MHYIYKITNLFNGKTYIGKHEYKDLNDDYMGSGKHLILAYKKYGIENFKKNILVFNIPREEQANILEKTFIASEREKVGRENCYNIADGGEGYSGANKGRPKSEETKAKMREAAKNRKFSSNEAKRRMWEARKGAKLSEEHKRKLREAHLGKKLGPHSEETRKKISEANKGKHWYNNGEIETQTKECPKGFILGRLRKQ